MTAELASQAGAEALYRITPPASASQVGTEYLFRVLAEYSVSQVGIEYLFKDAPCVSQWAQIWTITRSDGEVLRFTSLDRDLDYRGETYGACNSMVPSASENASEAGSVGNMELSGLIASGAVSMAELHAGLFDGANVEAWLVPWEGAGSAKALLRGTFGPVQYSANGFTVELLGNGGRLTQTPLVRTLQPTCRWIFGGPGCEYDIEAITVTGTVDAGDGQRAFTDAARAEAEGYFSRGRVTFTTGSNAGISAEIKEHASGGVFTLWPRLAFRIDAGDQYEMVPGCTHQLASSGATNGCEEWDNVPNYGGFPWVPGADHIRRPAKQGTS